MSDINKQFGGEGKTRQYLESFELHEVRVLVLDKTIPYAKQSNNSLRRTMARVSVETGVKFTVQKHLIPLSDTEVPELVIVIKRIV